jgi:hypothetical protein
MLELLGDVTTNPERFDAESGETHYRRALALAELRGCVRSSPTATAALASSTNAYLIRN